MAVARRAGWLPALAIIVAALIAGAQAPASARSSVASAPQLRNWLEFGLDPQRSDATELSTGITAANVGHLHLLTVALPGTVDNSAIYLHRRWCRRSCTTWRCVTTDLRHHGRDRRRQRPDPVDVHAARRSAPGGAARRSPPPARSPTRRLVRVRRLAQRPRPQAVARQRTRSNRAGRCGSPRRRGPRSSTASLNIAGRYLLGEHRRLHRRHSPLRRPCRDDPTHRRSGSRTSSTRSAPTATRSSIRRAARRATRRSSRAAARSWSRAGSAC